MKKYFLILFVLSIFFSTSLIAEESVVDTKRASSGMLIVAALESVGYHAQEQVLTQLNDMLVEVSSLIYLGVLVSIIITVALLGQYQALAWILIGPALFLYASGVEMGGQKNRISAKGGDWQFGAFDGDEAVKEKVMRRTDSPAQVSFLFHKYNELISELYQTIINNLTSKSTDDQVMFMARQRILDDLFSMDMTNPSGKELAAYLMAHCSTEMGYARAIAQGENDIEFTKTASFKDSQDKFCKSFKVKNKELKSRSLVEYIKSLNSPASGSSPSDKGYQDGEPVSCLDIWQWLRISISKDLVASSEESVAKAMGSYAGKLENVQSVYNDIKKKITTPPANQKNSNLDTCEFPFDSVGKDVVDGAGFGDAFNGLINTFSGLMIRKFNTDGANSTAFRSILGGDMSGVYSDESTVGEVRVSPIGKQDVIRRQKAQEMASGKQYEAFSLLMMVPYFQGLLLYILALTYPFFAMLILVPGQAGNFLNWLALWAWVKSWDIGWAMVMIVDRLLWEIMPRTTFYNTQNNGAYTPVNLFEMHYSGDYAYSVALYWSILVILIGAVPIISAEAILGSKKAIASAFFSGASDLSQRYGGKVETWVSTHNTRNIVGDRAQQEALKYAAANTNALTGLKDMDANAQKMGGGNGLEQMASEPLGQASAVGQAASDALQGKSNNGNLGKSLEKQGEETAKNTNMRGGPE